MDTSWLTQNQNFTALKINLINSEKNFHKNFWLPNE